ncbi:MAG TPA: hypothetical protein VFN37_14825 [Candidatus Baltobacteraceae bacterium]|nr:hypothetical protein [Candidatus Baltobacteraceae bacterium]
MIAASGTQFLRFPCSRRIRPLLVVPEIDLDTHSVRILLPLSYDRADVVFTAQRAAGIALSGAGPSVLAALRPRAAR